MLGAFIPFTVKTMAKEGNFHISWAALLLSVVGTVQGAAPQSARAAAREGRLLNVQSDL